MGEVKRIFLNSRRIALLVLITFLSLGFFLMGRVEFFGSNALRDMAAENRTYDWLVSQIKDLTPEERANMLSGESALLERYDTYAILGWDPEDDPEELMERMAERPYFRDADGTDETARRYNQIRLLLMELRNDSDYIDSYKAYLEQVQRQAQMQSQTALFGAKDSFSYRNLIKTAKEFAPLQDVEVTYGSNRAVTAWVEFETADYLYLALICVFVMAFLEERRTGLWGMIRATRGGGVRLWAQRVLVLAAASVLGTALIYGVTLVLSMGLMGGGEDLGRSVQSLPIFRTLTLHLTLGQWILLYLGVKIASGFLVGLILWCVLGSLANVQFSIAVLGGTLAVEYAFFELLPVQSILNPLKYFNLFSYIRTSRLYTDYLNIDLLGYPFGIRRLALAALPVLTALMLLGSYLQQRFRRPQGNRDLLGVLADGWNKAADVLRRRLPLGGWEVYKNLFFQRGVLILILVFVAAGSLSYFRMSSGPSGPNSNDTWYNAYLADLTGPVSGDMTEYFKIARESAKNDAQLLASIDKVEAHVNEVREKAAQGGYEPWIVKMQGYDMAYGPSSEDAQHTSAAVAMVFIILCTAAMGAFERQSGVVEMLRTTRRGRGRLIARKLLALLLPTALVWCAVYMREQWLFLSQWNPGTLQAPIGNLEELERFPLKVTMGEFMDLIYAVRFVMLFLTAAEVLWISQHLRSMLPAYAVSFAILGAPALLYALGVKSMRFLSPVRAVSGAEIAWGLGAAGGIKPLLPLIVWLAVGIAALVACFRSWTSNGTVPSLPSARKEK